jgi:hypothetical protein
LAGGFVVHPIDIDREIAMTFVREFGQGMAVVALAALFSANAAAVTTPTIEPRLATAPNSGQTVVFTFDKPVNGGTAAVTLGTAVVGNVTFGGTLVPPTNEMIVDLTGVADLQCVTVTVSNVTAVDGGTGGTGAASVRYIGGDVNGSGNVTLTDKGQVNTVLGLTVDNTNYLKDINASGTLTLTDKGLVNARLGNVGPASCP